MRRMARDPERSGEGRPEARAAEEPWTIHRVVTWAAGDLRKRGMTSPRLDAELLLGSVLGMTRVEMIVDAHRPLAPDELARYRALHQRRRAGEPVAYLLGVREFYGRPFRVDARVLVPRPETEVLVEVALERTRHLSMCMRALDLCTGSGCVAVTLARERPTACVLAADLSEGALAVAQENAIRLGAAANVAFLHCDLLSGLDPLWGKLDLITANPPYIPSGEIATLPADIRSYEPHLALDGGPDGLDLVRRIVSQAPSFLAKGGILALELATGQAPTVARLFADAGFDAIDIRKDLGGHDRVVSGRKP